MGGYDEYDRLVDTNPLELRDRCRQAEAKLAQFRQDVQVAIDWMKEPGVSGAEVMPWLLARLDA